MVWVLVGVRGCVAVDAGHGLVTLFVSVKGRSLHKALGKSQTYYPEHILGYVRLEDFCSLVVDPALSGPTIRVYFL